MSDNPFPWDKVCCDKVMFKHPDMDMWFCPTCGKMYNHGIEQQRTGIGLENWRAFAREKGHE